MGETEQLDDLNVDDESIPDIPDEAGLASLPDPVLDEELPDSQESAPPVQAGVSMPPEAPPPPASPELPPPPPQPAVSDGGFTPQPDAFRAPEQPAQPSSTIQFFTREQLKQGVEQGLITEDQMADQLMLQNRELAKQEAIRSFQDQERSRKITAQLDEYRRLVPGWDKPGTPANVRVNPIWQEMIRRGFPDTDGLKLEALERAFGTPDYIASVRRAKENTAKLRDTPQGIARRGPAQPSKKVVDPLKNLSKDELRLYQKYINSGVYGGGDPKKGWKEVREEIAYGATQTVNKDLRDKTMGLMR